MQPDWVALGVFIALFLAVTILGFVAANWRKGDLNILHEWGLGGSRFGTLVTWFLLGGDLYTAYTFVAVPGLVYGKGAIGFFAMPYTIVVYPLVFLFMPRLWAVARKHGYVTASDFVRGRYDSHALALAVAFTGILATLPYIALQLFGIEVSIAEMGVNPEIALTIAFVILAAFTFVSGLRAPALIAVVKDVMIYLLIIIMVIYIPIQLGGYGHIFAAAQAHFTAANAAAVAAGKPPVGGITLSSAGMVAFSTLALGSALALFMYPHAVTGVLASKDGHVVKRNMALLPAYSFLLGAIALLGYMAIAAGVKPDATYGANIAVPGLIHMMFPSWFAGFAFAAISIGALVPASVMSIAAANLFTRNIYKEYFRKGASPREEATTAKTASLVVKVGALAFVLIPGATAYAIYLQLLGGVWILQIFPALVFGLYTRWFNRWALLIGWAAGMIVGTYWAFQVNFAATYTFTIGGQKYAIYTALAAFIINLVIAVVLTPVFNLAKAGNGQDATASADYEQLSPVAAAVEG
ncbi:MAG TPA: sodium:solute symporter [Ktedonobacterales bacterium]|nr:sodium:solute symporter [Ktedonobacterales bacterium]